MAYKRLCTGGLDTDVESRYDRAMETHEGAVGGHTPKVPAALAYVAFFIPWFFGAQNNAQVRYHINQAFGLFLFGFILQGALTVILFWASFLGLYGISFMLVWAARIVYIILAVIGIMNAWRGHDMPLPWIGRYFPKVF